VCPRRAIDVGGCRCQAALLTGDAAATDPVCGFSPRRGLVDELLTSVNGTPATTPGWALRKNLTRSSAFPSSIGPVR
jgi:pyrroloquinoline quinone biosynthesis protein E